MVAPGGRGGGGGGGGGGQSASYSMGTGFLSWEYGGRGVNRLHLVLWLRTGEVDLYSPFTVSWRVQGNPIFLISLHALELLLLNQYTVCYWQ